MDVANPGRCSGDALYQAVIISEIGIAAEARALLIRRGPVTIGPGRNIGGTVLQFAADREIHVDSGAANDKISRERTGRRSQDDSTIRRCGGLDRRTLEQTKI